MRKFKHYDNHIYNIGDCQHIQMRDKEIVTLNDGWTVDDVIYWPSDATCAKEIDEFTIIIRRKK